MLQIDWSTKDVTTDKPIVIPEQFHIRLSKGCLDSQIVCALVIDSGEDIVVFVQGDLASVRLGVLDAIRAKVKARLPEINTTLNIYTHLSQQRQEDSKEKILKFMSAQNPD